LEKPLDFASLHATVLDSRTVLPAKWRVVWSVLNEGARERNLRTNDLSFADLRGGNFQNADRALPIWRSRIA
jgi:hypothetical protein